MSLAAFTTVRRRSPRHLIAALFLTLCLAFLSACGGSAPATPTPKPAAPKATTAPTSKPAAKASPAAGASPAASPGASPSPSPVAENPIEILDATLADATESAGRHALLRCARLRMSLLKWAFEGRLVDQDPTDEPASALLDRIGAEREAAEARKTPSRRRKQGKQ